MRDYSPRSYVFRRAALRCRVFAEVPDSLAHILGRGLWGHVNDLGSPTWFATSIVDISSKI